MLARMWKKGNSCTLLVGMQISRTVLDNGIEVPQKTANRTTIWSSNFTPGYISKENGNTIQKATCTQMLTVAPLTMAKTWKQPQCSSTNEWVKMWCTGRVAYYSAIKKEWNLVICNNMDGSTRYYAKWNKAKTKPIGSHLYVESKKQNKMKTDSD